MAISKITYSKENYTVVDLVKGLAFGLIFIFPKEKN
jgi:hypothetical protein